MSFGGIAQAFLGPAGALVTGLIDASANRRAAAQQERRAQEALNLQRETAAQQRQDAAPFIETGQRAIGTLAGTVTPFQSVAVNGQLPDDVNPSTVGLPTFENDQLFQFQQEAGERAINRALAARGQFFSGAAFETLSDFNRQLSGEEARRERERLAGLGTLGANTSLQLGRNQNQLVGFSTETLGNIGNAQARGILGNAAAVTGAIDESVESQISGAQQQDEGVATFLGAFGPSLAGGF